MIGMLAHKSWQFFLCVLIFLSSLIFYLSENPNYVDITLSFLVYFSAYLILSAKLFRSKYFSAAFVAGIICLYNLLFALDTFVNHEVETWIYQNHESIILVLHVALVCLFSQRCNTILADSWHNSVRVFNNLLRLQFGNYSHKWTESAKGDK